MKKIKYIEFLIGLIIIACLGCNSQIKQSNNAKKEIKPSIIRGSEENANINKWVYYYNLKSDSIKYLYAQNSIKILEDGSVLNGRERIKDNISEGILRLDSVKRDTLILAHKERAIEYEIVENIYENDERSKALIIWQTKDDERRRVFEFVSNMEESKLDHIEINKRRGLWISLCNEHNAEKLINELYSKNTLYFNHKPIVKGRAQLYKEYGYMNNEHYELSLEPEIVEKVNEDIIFEIGQCSGSYRGKYILIWQKDEDSVWRIFIDSNI